MRPHPARPDSGWAPCSPCEPGVCVVAGEPCVPIPLAVARLIGVVLALLGALPLALVYPFLDRDGRAAVARGWFRLLLRTLSIRVAGIVRPGPPGGSLVVSNHVSWVDILVLGSLRPGRIVAKTDIRSWPVLGSLAVRAGTVFVDRVRLSALPGAVAQVSELLRSGARVLAFPEGTTWCGAEGGRFRPALFQAAIDAGVPVEPISIRYRADERAPPAVAASREPP